MKTLLKWHCVIALSMLLFSIPLQAAENDDVIAHRIKVMKSINSNLGSLGDVLKGKVDQKELAVNYAKIAHELSKTVPVIFKQDTRASEKKNRSKAAVWDEWSGFEGKANAFIKANATLVEAAESGDLDAIAAAQKGLGATCSSCHKVYRGPRVR